MRVIIADKLYLYDFPPKAKQAIKRGCEITNPLFHKMRKMGKPYVHLSEFIRYWKEDKQTGTLTIPVGCEERLRTYCAHTAIQPEWEDRRVRPALEGTEKLSSTIKLREYQEGQPERIVRSERGICRFDTGYGKTIVALKVIEELQTPALIIVPRTNIYAQFKSDIQTYFGFVPATIDDLFNEEQHGARITLCTIQALQRRLDRVGFTDAVRTRFGVLIVDEAHTVVPEKSRAVVEAFSSKHRYGFTATAKRTDGQGDAIAWIFGPIIAEGTVERASPTVEILYNYAAYAVDEYHFMVEDQSTDPLRINSIADVVADEVKSGRRVLVLTKRVAHYEELYRSLQRNGTVRSGEDGVF